MSLVYDREDIEAVEEADVGGIGGAGERGGSKLATVVVHFKDGKIYQYTVHDLAKAKTYAHQISTGRGFRIPSSIDGRKELVYFPLHAIDRVVVLPDEGETDVERIVEGERREADGG